MVINCSTNTSDNVTLFKTDKTGKKETEVSGNKKIKSAAKNVFNITNINNTDNGYYVCKVCDSVSPKYRLRYGSGKILTKC
jgi:hypothetical protein